MLRNWLFDQWLFQLVKEPSTMLTSGHGCSLVQQDCPPLQVMLLARLLGTCAALNTRNPLFCDTLVRRTGRSPQPPWLTPPLQQTKPLGPTQPFRPRAYKRWRPSDERLCIIFKNLCTICTFECKTGKTGLFVWFWPNLTLKKKNLMAF